MPRRDMDIVAVRLARRSQNKAGFKRQSARLESSPPSEIGRSLTTERVPNGVLKQNSPEQLWVKTKL